MAKPKNRKKHQFKYANPTPNAPAEVSAHKPIVAPAYVAAEPKTYVVRDLRRIGKLAIAMLVLELILWYLLNHTGVGPAIYNMIKL